MRHPSIHFPCVVPSSSTTPTGIALTIVGGIDENYFSKPVVLYSTAYTKRHQLRSVGPNRLSNALSIFLTTNLSNQFAKGATK